MGVFWFISGLLLGGCFIAECARRGCARLKQEYLVELGIQAAKRATELEERNIHYLSQQKATIKADVAHRLRYLANVLEAEAKNP